MGAAIEATIKISVTTIIISSSEKPSWRWAVLALGPSATRRIGAIPTAPSPTERTGRDENRRDVCATACI
jgi:hypothetical protein